MNGFSKMAAAFIGSILAALNITTSHPAQIPYSNTTPSVSQQSSNTFSVPSWSTYSDEHITFQYPSDWTISGSNVAYGVSYSVTKPTYPITQSLPFFTITVTNKALFDRGTRVNSTINNFLDPYATYTDVSVAGRNGKRTVTDLSHGRWIRNAAVVLYIPDKNEFTQVNMYDIGSNFDQQIRLWFNPIVASLRLNP